MPDGGTRLNRRVAIRTAAVAGGAAVLASCTAQGGPSKGSNDGSDSGAGAPDQPAAKVTSTPADGATDVGVHDKIELKVDQGKFEQVTVANKAGKKLKGTLADDKLTWTSAEELGYGKTYTYTAKATGTDGKPVQASGKFTTVKPKNVVRATLYPGDDAEVGVGMPVSVRFAAPVKDRKAVEKALTLHSTPTVEGSWGWINDQQVDWRPKKYWPAHTKIKLAAKLYGVDFGGGAFGKEDVTTSFKIGRNQVVKVHTPDHKMRVYRSGKLTQSYPSSNGLDSNPDRCSPNGTFIIMSKEPKTRFDNARYGYTNVWKKWAMRLSNHGEYIHENQENAGAIGSYNNSHGCVNLLEADAKKFYDSALVGDPVEVTGSIKGAVKTSEVNDWLFSWSQWQQMA